MEVYLNGKSHHHTGKKEGIEIGRKEGIDIGSNKAYLTCISINLAMKALFAIDDYISNRELKVGKIMREKRNT